MGSPGNTLGNDPIAAYYPHYWMNVFQRNDTKVNGERFHTQACAADAAVSCSGGVNEEYDEDGYRFTVDVSSVQGASLTFDFFDIVHTQTDSHCTAAYLFADASTQPFYAANVKGLANYPPERYEDATSSGGWRRCRPVVSRRRVPVGRGAHDGHRARAGQHAVRSDRQSAAVLGERSVHRFPTTRLTSRADSSPTTGSNPVGPGPTPAGAG